MADQAIVDAADNDKKDDRGGGSSSNNSNTLTNNHPVSIRAAKYALSNEELEGAVAGTTTTGTSTTASEPPAVNRQQPANTRRLATQQQPGAYSGGSQGEDLQRRNKVPFSLIGVEAAEKSSPNPHNRTEDSGRVGEEKTLEEEETKSPIWWRRKPVILAGVFLLIIATTAAVAIVLLLRQSIPSSESGQQQQQQQQQQQDKSTNKEERVHLVPNMTNATKMALENPFSYQSRAYAWIARDPNWDTYEDWRKQQRFAMLCLFYSFGEDATFVNPTSPTHECNWLVRFDPCSSSGGSGKDSNSRGGKIIHRIGFVRSSGSSLAVPVHHKTSLDGRIPQEIAFLSNLEDIDFVGDDGEFPPLEEAFPIGTIRNLPPIKSLKIDHCRASGSIPSTLGLITSLTSLELSASRLESAIPSQLGLLSDLETLTLSSNELTGGIPNEIGGLSSLINMDVSNNPELESYLPSGFCSDDRMPFESLETDWCSNTVQNVVVLS